MNLPMFQLNRPSSSSVAAKKGPDKKALAKRMAALRAARAAAETAKKA